MTEISAEYFLCICVDWLYNVGLYVTVDPFIDDLIYSALSSGENAKSKRDNKKSKTSSTQTDQSKIRGSTRKIQFLHPLIKGITLLYAYMLLNYELLV